MPQRLMTLARKSEYGKTGVYIWVCCKVLSWCVISVEHGLGLNGDV